MNLECSCNYRGHNCQIYCKPLQPPSNSVVYHYHREGDPLRELNRCCDLSCDCHPRVNRCPSRSHAGYISECNMQHNSTQYCSMGDGERNSASVQRTQRSQCDYGRKHASYAERNKYSAEMREKYVQEMEALKAKLNFLRHGALDGKRSRRRSESEPGSSAGILHKRGRDLSPPLLLQRRRCQGHANVPFQRETRSVPPTMPVSLSHVQIPTLPAIRHMQAAVDPLGKDYDDEPLSDVEANSSGDDDLRDVEINEQASEDDYSLQSEVTSASTDSNTPLHVGRSLGSISLNEGLQVVPCSSTSSHVIYSAATVSSYTQIFRPSLFSNVPPYVRFALHDSKGPDLPIEVSKLLKWKLSTITPIVIRRTLINSGFKLIRKTNDWTGQWGKHMNSFMFKTLKDFQKLNHFPGTFQIGRKDRLWKNLNRLMLKFGKREFGFIPTTYILPQDNKSLRIAWEKLAGKGQWIVKPPAAARGTGIRVVHRWSDIPKNKPLIVQKYIAQPYLINGSKFDLRLYVLMTSIHPLRIYLYDDGLVRFASVKYSENMESLGDRFMHLTNYSINKLSSQYCANEDAASCQGHKWTLKTLWVYLEKQGVNVKALRRSMTDLVIKTIISGESHIQALSKNNLPSRYCSYELFGIDVLLDSELRPWLLEVNISPSLHSSSPLDLAVKGPLVKELLNVAGFQIPAKLTQDQEAAFLEQFGLIGKTNTLCYDKRLYTATLSREERVKHASHNLLTRSQYLDCILERLTPDDVRHLVQFEDELTQIKRFEKVFPTVNTHTYHQYFDSPRYYNMMLDAWENKYHSSRADGIRMLESYCQQDIHLQVPFPGSKTKSSVSQSGPNAQGENVGGPETSSDEEQEIRGSTQPLTRSGRRRKTGLLTKPHLRAAVARRQRMRTAPDLFLPPVENNWNLLQTCKLESGVAPSTQLPALDIRSNS